MKKKNQFSLSAAVALTVGIIGLFLRWYLIDSVNRHGTGAASSPAAVLLWAITGVTIAALLIFAKKDDRSMRVRIPVTAIGAFLGALGILLSDIIGAASVLDCLIPAVGIAGLIGFGWCCLRGKDVLLIFPVLICLYALIWPIAQYREWSSCPQAYDYVFQVFAAVFLMLYSCRVAHAEKNTPDWSRPFFGRCAMLFCLVCLPCDRWPFFLGSAVWCFSQEFRSNPPMALPEDVRECIRTLDKAGHATYVVGGCVRDFLMGIPCQDFDLCTSATPEEICDIFGNRSLIHSGEKHGTVGVIIRRQVYEITTFRSEGGYSDNRHPDWVKFVPTIREDLARRDFTVNAIAYSPREGYIDPYGGQQDLENGILRCVGNPFDRFREDSLRILRGIRFSARLGFSLDAQTERAMEELAPLMDSLARERVYDELCKFLLCAKAEDLLRFAPILSQVIPELKPAFGFAQHSTHHAYDVFTHIAHVTAAAPRELSLRWAALLHDIAKPKTFSIDDLGRGHFLGHAVESAQIANDILLRLRAPSALREETVWLIENHMMPTETDKKVLRRRLSRYGESRLKKLIALQRADFTSKGVRGQDPGFDPMETALEEILAESTPLQMKDLAVSGYDLMELGLESGPQMGECLTHLMNLVLDETVPNEKELLLQKAAEYMKSRGGVL